jgi:phosphohistidine phosphatase SixA
MGLIQCQSLTNHSPKLVTAIRGGRILFSDGSQTDIPHYNDPEYIKYYCVRHCEKEKNNNDPDLTPEGRARAERLGRVMDNAMLNMVATTSTKRTMQTGEAVQRWAGDPDFINFPPDMLSSWLEDQFVENRGKHIFHVGHQNTIPQMLNKLTGTVQYKNIPDLDFNHFYIVATKGFGQSEVLDLRY